MDHVAKLASNYGIIHLKINITVMNLDKQIKKDKFGREYTSKVYYDPEQRILFDVRTIYYENGRRAEFCPAENIIKVTPKDFDIVIGIEKRSYFDHYKFSDND